MKDIAPSPELRKSFGHMPDRFAAFSDRYIRELEEGPERESLPAKINKRALEQQVTLVYAAKDSMHNHVAVLYKWLLSR